MTADADDTALALAAAQARIAQLEAALHEILEVEAGGEWSRFTPGYGAPLKDAEWFGCERCEAMQALAASALEGNDA